MYDLSKQHGPISDLFRSCDQSDREQFRISDDQIEFFNNSGYLSGIQILNELQLEALRLELELFFDANHAGFELWYEYNSNESTDPNQVLFHALGAWRIKPAFHDLLWNPAFTIPASQLLNGAVRFWHDQLFCKPARHGGQVAWHQDYSYWTRTQPMQHLTCWIGLDDATIDNGCIQYIPGSHRWDLLPITGLAGDMDAIKQVLSAEQWEQLNNPVPIELKAGQGAFHHPLMVHGSAANNTDRPRRATVINVVKDGVCSYSDEPLLAGTDAIPKGEPLAGQFFPLLYQPQQAPVHEGH